jgi:hypothetical protein
VTATGRDEVKALLLKSAYKLVDGLLEEPQLPILLFKIAVDAAVLLFLLFAVGELAASLWRVSEGLTRSLP